MDPSITFIKGDATKPIGDGAKIVVHICNDIGVWGAGFVLSVSRRWPEVEKKYRLLARGELHLGDVQFVDVGDDVIVANLIGQSGIRSPSNASPISYIGIKAGLEKVADRAIDEDATVHMPRIGCGLAGGSWSRVEEIIQRELVSNGINVFVYDLRK